MGNEIRQTATGGLQVRDDQSGGDSGVVRALAFTATRAPTNTIIAGILPANAQLIRIDITVPVLSNAVTTATVSVGLSGGSATFFSAAQDVKAAIGTFSQAATANWIVNPASQIVSCTYTETGGASTLGIFNVAMIYVVL